jgi:hypothetical protein
MTDKEISELQERVFDSIQGTSARIEFLRLIQAYHNQIISLTFERQNLIHQLNKTINE